ncbi:MAG: 3-hydroxybutyrate dehydrogenase [Verrucomicrobiaceae bacterium]|nr:3-hydroxybutyrate dehydrogenase [Verrucomicrobiaceae bacterium]
MNLHLQNKRALITGSTSGIGFAIAQTLAQEGAEVIITGRTQERVDSAVTKIKTQLPDAKVQGFAGDLAQAEVTEKLTRAVPNIDILVNNLGIYAPKAFAEISDAEWHQFIETNFMSGLRLARFYLPQLLQRDWGRIVFIASESAFDVPKEMIHYGVTKTMQVSLARGLASLCAGSQVTVNSLLPGPTRSEGVDEFIGNVARETGVDKASAERDFFTQTRPNSLLRRFATTTEIAAFCAYIVSPLAAATNGAALRADGGIINSLQ